MARDGRIEQLEAAAGAAQRAEAAAREQLEELRAGAQAAEAQVGRRRVAAGQAVRACHVSPLSRLLEKLRGRCRRGKGASEV